MDDDLLLLIPIQGADEFVRVSIADLNEELTDDVIAILAAEVAPLKLWLSFAVSRF
jgi:hypothetical protein